MKSNDKGDVRAFVQTAEQGGEHVWVITLVDFAAREVRRSLVSDETYATAAAARDAGQAHLKGLEQDR
ncbi:hypothetical protein [Paraburkholderia sp. BR13444]|uniref:hypothetical protein n=1 Tax=Paraburkholderia sp. BR13444 TaxID=3236997 RepID=UPI0034CD9CE6